MLLGDQAAVAPATLDRASRTSRADVRAILSVPTSASRARIRTRVVRSCALRSVAVGAGSAGPQYTSGPFMSPKPVSGGVAFGVIGCSSGPWRPLDDERPPFCLPENRI